MGLTRSDDTLVASSGTTAGGVKIYERGFGSGFTLVIEARRGGSNANIEASTFQNTPFDPLALPGLMVFVSRPLGNGSLAVCDDALPMIGGVPATNPPDLNLDTGTVGAINDLGCRFRDGSGVPAGRMIEDACTAGKDGTYGAVDRTSVIQFCGIISEPLSFLIGDTLVTARVRDVDGNISAPMSMIVRVQ